MNKRILKKKSKTYDGLRSLPEHLQIKASKWFSPWTIQFHNLQIGDKYLNCRGEVREIREKKWDAYQYILTDEEGNWCHTDQCVDCLRPEDKSIPNGTKLSDELLNIYWGKE